MSPWGSNAGTVLSAEIRLIPQGWRHSPESRAKISRGLKGKPKSDAHKIKLIALGLSRKGLPGHPHSAETRAKMSAAHKGVPKSPSHREKLSRANMGHKDTQETRRKKSIGHLGIRHSAEECVRISERQRGALGPNWRGGLSSINACIRASVQYREWRDAIKKRDDYTCRLCGKRGGVLHSDHIKPFAFYPELRFDLSNGRTLCRECHRKTPTFCGRCRAA